ncbi:leucine rich repeat protein [Leptospira borgpetersenii serovar Pomona str. 200901868]|uniref:Leucine rich repeat protein n=1 Tax=Leptospira borgpetersenii serovar Pomona str. 200901868 TaxID=1192866 RepID=M6W276_LEPBO|nr:leucine rich repeat protein [Leptospira borgpetersenii serovar Pomona str. 200901868]
MGEDYTVMQNILCKMSKEIILQTLKEDSFLQIEKQTPYYLIFAYYHDDEESEVIFDSSGKIKNSPYPELTKKGIDLSKLYNSKDKSMLIEDRNLEEIPKEIGDMDSMYSLRISKSKVRSLPDTIGKLKNCKQLDIQKNQIEFLPETIGTMENLEELSAGNNKLTDLPESIYQLKKLKEIGLWENPFSQDQKAKIVSRLKENIPGIKINIDK